MARMLYFVPTPGGGFRQVEAGEWADWFCSGPENGCLIAYDDVPGGFVRTVFAGTPFVHYLGHDSPNATPPLWHTYAAFTGRDGVFRRYTSREEAVAGHRQLVLEHQGYQP